MNVLINDYLDDCKARLKITTYITRQRLIRNQIVPFFKETYVHDLRPIDVRKWQNTLLNQTPKLSPTYIDSIFYLLKDILNYGVKFYDVAENVAIVTGKVRLRKTKRLDFWTEAEFKQFIKHISHQKRSYTAFYILFYTGLRIGELLALSLNDIDLDNHTITVNKTYKRLERTDLITTPKTSSSIRTVHLPTFLSDIIKTYVDSLDQYNHHERLFPLCNSTLQKVMKKYSKIAGVKVIRIHDLRHSHASHLIELDFSPKLIQQRLGHSKATTTLEIYAHLYPNKQKEVSKKLDETFQKRVNTR
jgi:integrase